MPGVEMPNTVCVRPSAGICPLALGVLWRSCRAHGVLGMISTSGPLTALLSELRAYCTPLPLPKLSAGRDARGAQRCSGGGDGTLSFRTPCHGNKPSSSVPWGQNRVLYSKGPFSAALRVSAAGPVPQRSAVVGSHIPERWSSAYAGGR